MSREFREDSPEQMEQENGEARNEGEADENRDEIIEKKVQEIAKDELRKKVRDDNQYYTDVLETERGNVIGIVDSLEKTEEVTENLIKKAFDGSDKDLSESFFGTLTEVLNMLKPIGDFDVVMDAFNSKMDDEAEKNFNTMYKEYYENNEEGKKRIREIESEVESEYKKE